MALVFVAAQVTDLINDLLGRIAFNDLIAPGIGIFENVNPYVSRSQLGRNSPPRNRGIPNWRNYGLGLERIPAAVGYRRSHNSLTAEICRDFKSAFVPRLKSRSPRGRI